MTNTKKIVLMSTLVLLLAVTAIFNFVLAGTRTTATAGGNVETNYFAAYATDSAEYKEAVAMKQQMVEMMEDELILETMIKSLGFSDVVVAIGSDSDNINVFINSNELDLDTVTKIFQRLENETSVREGNVIIMPIYAES